MTSTTIKVDTSVRDRLKAQAAAAQLTLGEHLKRLADMADRQTRLATLRDAVAGTPKHLAASHRAESEAWEATELADARDL